MNNHKVTPFEKLIDGVLSSVSVRKVNDVHPEDFKVVMDSIYSLFFGHKLSKDRKLGIEGMTDYDGIRVEFSSDITYPFIKRDRKTNYKVIVLPDKYETNELKLNAVKETLKEFDCLESIEKYELCLRIFNSFSEPELIILAREYDPYHRNIKKLEERFLAKSNKQKKKT